VDGFEFPVISGGLQIIERSRPTVIIEATGAHLADDSANPFLVLSSLGYTLWDIAGRSTVTIDTLRRRLPANDPTMFSLNLVAKPRERAQ
jgi:hypothetical protein